MLARLQVVRGAHRPVAVGQPRPQTTVRQADVQWLAVLPWRNTVPSFAAVPLVGALLAPCSGADDTVSPTDFVSAHAKDAHSVVVAVQEVQAGVGVMADSGSGRSSDLASLDGLISDAQSTFDDVNHVLLDAPKPKDNGCSATEMWSATGELSSAMKSVRDYLDDGKPSQLADYKMH
jgi:hypothetical protein